MCNGRSRLSAAEDAGAKTVHVVNEAVFCFGLWITDPNDVGIGQISPALTVRGALPGHPALIYCQKCQLLIQLSRLRTYRFEFGGMPQ